MAVALYARVSTVRQAEKDLSIPDQLNQMRDWAAANGFAVAMEYIEAGASATDDKRPVFQQMMASYGSLSLVESAIMVWNTGRLSSVAEAPASMYSIATAKPFAATQSRI